MSTNKMPEDVKGVLAGGATGILLAAVVIFAIILGIFFGFGPLITIILCIFPAIFLIGVICAGLWVVITIIRLIIK